MGRPEKPIDSNDPVGAFSRSLRELRAGQGSPSYRELAKRTGDTYTATALSKAASGTRLPTFEVTIAFVRACNGDEGEWGQRWRTAKAMLDETRGGWSQPVAVAATRARQAEPAGFGARWPDPAAATTPGELAQEMRLLKIWAGDPSFERLARRAAVSRSTLHAALRGDKLPKLGIVKAFVIACGANNLLAWEWAWKNIAIAEELRDSPKARQTRLKIVRAQHPM